VDELGGVDGLRALYVALTRATKTLVIVHAKPLPDPVEATAAHRASPTARRRA
jgi:ATP-dependent exoDNAse (exonuclease V) beta subunit